MGRECEYQISNYPGDVIPDNAEGQSISSDTASIVDRRLKVTRLEVTRLGFKASLSSEQRALLLTAMGGPDDRVRAGALGAIVRLSSNEAAQAVIEPAEVQEAWRSAQVDQSPNVRRRAAELAPKVSDLPIELVIELVADSDVTVAEAAAWALGVLRWLRCSKLSISMPPLFAISSKKRCIHELSVKELDYQRQRV